jgi:tRNA (guanosine-2'-O-)-methyltransferase
MPTKYQKINLSERTESRKEKINSVLEKRQSTLTVVAENIYDPHNLSAMLRSCDAVGILEVSLVYDGRQSFPKIGSKSSASAKKWIDFKKYTNIKKCYDDLKNRDFKIYSTHLGKDAISLYDIDFTQSIALVFGNEHTGVSEEATKYADANFIIPQVGMIQSLNISVACAVSVYEAFRQRLNAGLYEKSQIKDAVFKNYFKNWLSK